MTGLTALALLASVLLGVSDFLGGALSRKVPLITVLLLSEVFATLAVVPRLFWEPFSFAAEHSLLWGVIGGVATAIGVSSLFKALAIGTMGVVAPITALSVVVPVVVGLAQGDQLTIFLSLGLVIAVVGTILASSPELRSRTAGKNGPKAVGLALLSAVGFGFANLSVALGSTVSVSTTLLTTNVTVLVIYAVVAVALRQVPRVWGLPLVGIIAIGVLGFTANLCFALASLDGALSVVAVLASLYPVVTVLLGWRIFKERLLPIQIAGVIAVFIGIAAIAATV